MNSRDAHALPGPLEPVLIKPGAGPVYGRSLVGCGCAGGNELDKVTTGTMNKPATGRKTGKAPKPKTKEDGGDMKK